MTTTSTKAINRRRAARMQPVLDSLEDRTMLDGAIGLAAVAGGAEAYVTQLYIDTLNRLPSAGELNRDASRFERPGGPNTVAVQLLTSREFRTNQVNEMFLERLGVEPTQQQLQFGINTLGSRGPRVFEALVLGSNQYFQEVAQGDNATFVRSAYSAVLGVNPDESAQVWVDQLDRGLVNRSLVAFRLLSSEAAGKIDVNEIYSQYLGTVPSGEVVDRAIAQLNAGSRSERLIRDLVISDNYRDQTTSVTDSIGETIVGAGNFTILTQALQLVGFTEVFSTGGPFTIFAPTDEAFQALPDGVLDDLLKPENLDQLTDILAYHVVGRAGFGTEIAAAGLLPTALGEFVGVADFGDQLFVNTSLITTPDIRTTNGVIHVIDEVLLPPTQTIVETVAEIGDFSTLVAALGTAGLEDLSEVLAGDGPFTLFAPTNDAFDALPDGLLDSLLEPENQDQLRTLLLTHAVLGRFPVPGLANFGLFGTGSGLPLLANRFNGATFINQARVIDPNVVATNGVIHAIDAVLIPTGFTA